MLSFLSFKRIKSVRSSEWGESPGSSPWPQQPRTLAEPPTKSPDFLWPIQIRCRSLTCPPSPQPRLDINFTQRQTSSNFTFNSLCDALFHICCQVVIVKTGKGEIKNNENFKNHLYSSETKIEEVSLQERMCGKSWNPGRIPGFVVAHSCFAPLHIFTHLDNLTSGISVG